MSQSWRWRSQSCLRLKIKRLSLISVSKKSCKILVSIWSWTESLKFQFHLGLVSFTSLAKRLNLHFINLSFMVCYADTSNLVTTYSKSKSWTWRIRICFTIVDLPDSPAPVNTLTCFLDATWQQQKHVTNMHPWNKYTNADKLQLHTQGCVMKLLLQVCHFHSLAYSCALM